MFPYDFLPIQPLGPPLKPIKLYLWRFAIFSALKFSGSKLLGCGYET
jgi:hypothetical protein